ncbi:MAG: hypothetical protein CMP22_07225 [Rickettsiales bacterium]|nr:hypothetical protein [Rickettsiales bacterium]|tara:strand:+ start:268 stop:567 length:300 start_codon:yes stop_codon:yes gene_type:complete
MASYSEFLIPIRRLSILELLYDSQGKANDKVLQDGLDRMGFSRVSRAQIRDDIRFLIDNGCVIDHWVGDICVVEITHRGVDVAQGREIIDGVKQPEIGV